MSLDHRDIRYAKSGDAHLAYMVVGEGPIDLVWSSPGISNVEGTWEAGPLKEGVERLSSFSRFITYDQRGTGLSDPLPQDAVPTLEERGDDIRVVLDAVGSERAVIVAQGHGGPACMLFAGSHPERTSALVLYDTYARWLRDDDYPAGMPADATAKFRAEVQRIWGSGATIQAFLPSRAHDERELRAWARVERMGASVAGIASLMKVWTETDVRDILPSIRVPTLVIQRKEDVQFRVGHGRYLADHIPAAKYLELPGADHILVGDDLEMLAGEIEEFVLGRRSHVPMDRLLATVMFTDIVDSTVKASDVGDHAWRQLLDRHDDTINRQLERYRGEIFSHTGDGVAATFDGPARAITCACAIRDALRGNGLEIRAGLHTGEIVRRRDGMSGVGVHIAARVAQLGTAGEVLVSSTVRDLVVGSGITFEDRGMHDLKGVPDQWRVLKVLA